VRARSAGHLPREACAALLASKTPSRSPGRTHPTRPTSARCFAIACAPSCPASRSS
jgi:hypothetical protein